MAIIGKIKTLFEDKERTQAIFPRTHAKAVTDLIDTIYPVGSIYMNINYHHPAELFGGTWELISGRFLVGHGSNGVDLEVLAGQTGGEAKHTLTVNEMPSHNHRAFIARNQSGYGYNALAYEAYIASLGSNVNVTTQAGQLTNINTHMLAPTNTIGGSQPHNNLPPYLAVYIWKRTA